MLKYLFIKDVKLMLKELKFQLFFILLLILFSLSGIISGIKYNNRQQEYLSLRNTKENFVRQYSGEILSMIDKNVIIYLNKPALSSLIHNREELPHSLSTNTIVFTTNVDIAGVRSNEIFNFNWMFIVSILSSFIVLIFSFNSISYEKNQGTLRLKSSFGIKRSTIIISKYLSLSLIYLMCLLPAMIISLLSFFIISGSFNLVFIFESFIFIFASVIYTTFFILLGIFISLSKNFRSGIVIALTMWLLFVVIIPNSTGILTKKLYPIITQIEYNRQYNRKYWDVFREWAEKYDDDNAGIFKVKGNGFMQEGLRYSAILDAEQQAAMILHDYNNSKIKQIEFIDRFELLSPLGHLRLFTELILSEGLYKFKNELITLENKFNLINKELKNIDKEHPKSLHQMYKYANWDRHALDESDLVPFTVVAYNNPEKLVFSDYHKESLVYRFIKGSRYLFSLIIINLILFLFVFIKFLQMDIR